MQKPFVFYMGAKEQFISLSLSFILSFFLSQKLDILDTVIRRAEQMAAQCINRFGKKK